MTELINLTQLQEPGSELIELFELDVDGTILYFHSGLEADLTTVEFRDQGTPYTVREYVALPIMMGGIEYAADGAQNRPILTVANVLNVFSASLGGLRNDDLTGMRVTKRQTLKKYLFGEIGDASPPVEFPQKKYIIDRVSEETSLSVTFELSAPYDLSGVELPGRVVVGKYCPWVYQGHANTQNGGCIWKADSTTKYANGAGLNSHKAYFTDKDEPIVASTVPITWTAISHAVNTYVTYLGDAWRANTATDTTAPTLTNTEWDVVYTYTTYSGVTAYTAGDYVESGSTVWKCLIGSTGETPIKGSIYWVNADVCGKKLNSCKCRFQYVPVNPAVANSPPTIDRSDVVLPFGGFPGTKKFR
jgi:lambda family phage minor tail protein L